MRPDDQPTFGTVVRMTVVLSALCVLAVVGARGCPGAAAQAYTTPRRPDAPPVHTHPTRTEWRQRIYDRLWDRHLDPVHEWVRLYGQDNRDTARRADHLALVLRHPAHPTLTVRFPVGDRYCPFPSYDSPGCECWTGEDYFSEDGGHGTAHARHASLLRMLRLSLEQFAVTRWENRDAWQTLLWGEPELWWLPTPTSDPLRLQKKWRVF